MNIDTLHAAAKASRLAERAKESARPLTLGEAIDLLAALPDDRGLMLDFGGFEPAGISSYRGYYDELAIGHKPSTYGAKSTVAGLLDLLRGAVGATFQGYKGGDYTMTRATPLWVANYGESHGTALVGVRDLGYYVILETAYVEN